MTMETYTIPLTRGKETIVDKDIAELWDGIKWYCSSKGYAVTNIRNSDGKRTTLRLHRVVANVHGLPGDIEPDHINGNPLDNRRENLRICTHKQNLRSSKKPINNTTGFKGVSYDKRRNKFEAQIKVDNRKKYLGHFSTAEEAHSAYCAAAKKYHGEFARFK